jgi:catechol 2,3-dioxygenase-like lactoylglutathione lyase family enzyme
MKMSHAGIMVGEMARAVEFYTQALGLDIVLDNSEVIEEHEAAISKIR